MESHALDWPQSLRQVLDPNHGSEDTGKHTPLSTDHDSVEHVTVDHVNVHAAPSTYTGNTASVSPTRPRSASPSMSAVASSDQNARFVRPCTNERELGKCLLDALDWPQSLRQVLDPNHGSEDTGKLTPLSTDHDSVEHVTVVVLCIQSTFGFHVGHCSPNCHLI